MANPVIADQAPENGWICAEVGLGIHHQQNMIQHQGTAPPWPPAELGFLILSVAFPGIWSDVCTLLPSSELSSVITLRSKYFWEKSLCTNKGMAPSKVRKQQVHS